MAIPATIAYFVTYEQLRVVLHDEYIRQTGEIVQPLWIPLVSGAVARTWAVTIVNPLELIRTKMQSRKLTYRG
jgi:solute carrier family 25 protein 39/40